MKKSLFVLYLAAAFGTRAAITETTTDETASGDWEVTVAAGDSNVVTVAQSGGGKIVKKGGGYLVLRKNSTFTGGVELQEGFVMVDPDADAGTAGTVNCTALGSGDVTILGQRDGYTGYCELGIVGAGSNDTRIVTVANAINITGNTTGKYPGLVFYGQNSVLTGKITADQDFYFWEDELSTRAIWGGEYNRYLNVLAGTFGEIEAAGIIGYSGFCRFVFGGKVKTPKLDLTIVRTTRTGERSSNNYNNAHGGFVFTTPCEIVEIVDGHRYLWCAGANLLPGTLLRHTSYNAGHTQNWLRMWGNPTTTGYDQTLGGLVGEPLDDSAERGWGVEGKSSKTLTITGIAPDEGESTKELVTSSSIGSSEYPTFNLTIDAYDGFTQTVSNRNHLISKTIRVKKGAFRVLGSAKFPNLPSIIVDAGATFRMDGTNSAAFPAVKSLTVEGDFIVGPNAAEDFMTTGGYTEIRLASTANFSVPSGMAFKTEKLYVDGVLRPAGAWTHAVVPAIPEGVTITASSGPGATAEAEWTGAAESDNLMATMANWKDEPEALDFANYTLGVTITNNGTELVYADGTKIHSINFLRKPDATPFTIRPATKGGTLYVAGRIDLPDSGQLIFKDAVIATPGHIDQGSAGNNDHTMYMTLDAGQTPAIAPYTASNNVYIGGSGSNLHLPFILDNAIIEKPVRAYASITGYVPFYCLPGTTNEIKGAYSSAWQGYIRVPAGAQFTFSGGVSYTTYLHKYEAGTLIVKDKPIDATSYFLHHAGVMVLDAEDFELQGSNSGDGMTLDPNSTGLTLECRRSYCFNGNSCLTFRSGSNLPTVELHATTQRVTRLCGLNTKATSTIQGDPGSLLEVLGGWGKGRTKWDDGLNSTFKLLTNRVDIAGALSFKMSATNETMTFYAKAFSTCGDLEVSAGTLDFRSDATWLNGTNVAVNGEGRLKVAKGGTFTGKFAELALADAGVFEIPSGESQIFNYVTTNGVLVSSGRYTLLPNGEGDFLAGGGEIVVRRHGIVFSLR